MISIMNSEKEVAAPPALDEGCPKRLGRCQEVVRLQHPQVKISKGVSKGRGTEGVKSSNYHVNYIALKAGLQINSAKIPVAHAPNAKNAKYD